MAVLAKILNIDALEFQRMLLYSKILIPRQEAILKVMDAANCMANRNTLCKAIYSSIFDYILGKLQAELSPST